MNTEIDLTQYRYTMDEVLEKFRTDETIDDELRGYVVTHLTGYFQAIFHSVYDKDRMHISDSNGCWFKEGHNEFVEQYQKYHN